MVKWGRVRKIRYRITFPNCLSKMRFRIAFPEWDSELHSQNGIQNCLPKVGFRIAFPKWDSELHFQNAIQICLLKIRFQIALTNRVVELHIKSAFFSCVPEWRSKLRSQFPSQNTFPNCVPEIPWKYTFSLKATHPQSRLKNKLAKEEFEVEVTYSIFKANNALRPVILYYKESQTFK